MPRVNSSRKNQRSKQPTRTADNFNPANFVLRNEVLDWFSRIGRVLSREDYERLNQEHLIVIRRGEKKTFYCELCDATSDRHNRLSDTAKHRGRVSILLGISQNQIPRLGTPCEICNKRFGRRDLLNKHIREDHPDGEQAAAEPADTVGDDFEDEPVQTLTEPLLTASVAEAPLSAGTEAVSQDEDLSDTLTEGSPDSLDAAADGTPPEGAPTDDTPSLAPSTPVANRPRFAVPLRYGWEDPDTSPIERSVPYPRRWQVSEHDVVPLEDLLAEVFTPPRTMGLSPHPTNLLPAGFDPSFWNTDSPIRPRYTDRERSSRFSS